MLTKSGLNSKGHYYVLEWEVLGRMVLGLLSFVIQDPSYILPSPLVCFTMLDFV